MSLVFRILSFFLALSIFNLSGGAIAGARQIADGIQTDKGQLVGSAGLGRISVSKENMKDGQSFVDKWFKTADSYQDYTFDYDMTVYKPSGPVSQKGALAFKRPRLLRIEVDSGPNAGAVAVLQADGKVRAHMGGGLKLFVVNLSPHSDLLRSANGWPMVDSDFTSLAVAIQQYLKEGCVSRVSESPVAAGETGTKAYVLEVYKGSADGELYKRALFDPQTILPFEWWDYKDGGKLFAHSTWSNFKGNVALTDKAFTIKGDK